MLQPRSTPDRYKWVALSNTTLGVLLATLDASIVIIAMPDIFRGIHLDPLVPANSFYLLWMILGYLVVSSVLIVSLGRLGDMFGRVKMYNLGFVIYTVASLLLTIDWLTGRPGALFLVVWRIVQGVGGAFLLANSGANRRVPRPPARPGPGHQQHRRHQRLVHRPGPRRGPRADRLAAGLPGLGPGRALRHGVGLPEAAGHRRAEPPAHRLARQRDVRSRIDPDHGRHHLRHPARHSSMGWGSPTVDRPAGHRHALADRVRGGRGTKVEHPMFRLALFRIKAFTFGTLSTFLSALGRGGLMFMLIIWLQGIWLPLHGSTSTATPLAAGIHMLPLTPGS